MNYEVVIRLNFQKRPRKIDVTYRLFDHMKDNCKSLEFEIYKLNKEKKIYLAVSKGKKYAAK